MFTVNKNASGWNGDNKDPWGGPSNNRRQPNFENPFDGLQKNFNKFFPGGGKGKRGLFLLILVAILLWSLSGLYRVNADEQGVVLRFGKFVSQTSPGLHYHLPWPIETVKTPKVTIVNRIDIGMRGSTSSNFGNTSRGMRDRFDGEQIEGKKVLIQSDGIFIKGRQEVKINAPNLSVIKDEVKLGSRDATQAVVLGDELKKILDDIASVLKLLPVAIDNTQSPLSAKDPGMVGKIAGLTLKINNMLSKKVKTI